MNNCDHNWHVPAYRNGKPCYWECLICGDISLSDPEKGDGTLMHEGQDGEFIISTSAKSKPLFTINADGSTTYHSCDVTIYKDGNGFTKVRIKP